MARMDMNKSCATLYGVMVEQNVVESSSDASAYSALLTYGG